MSLGGMKMRSFRDDVERAVAFHGHLCSGQCLGVRMAHMGLRLLGLDNERDRKKLLVFLECNRCPADAIMIATGCTVGKRTYYCMDMGKTAAIFVHLETGRAVRVVRTAHRHPAEGEDLLEYYETLPEEGWLEAREVVVELKRGDLPGPPAEVVTCARCGEEVTDGRHVEVAGAALCRGCAGKNYYRDVDQAREYPK